MTAAVKGQARDLEADLAICEAATPGKWETDGFSIFMELREDNRGGETIARLNSTWPVNNRNCEDDCAFIATAREGWPYAIRRALEAEAKIDRLEAEIGVLVEQINSNGRRGPWD